MADVKQAHNIENIELLNSQQSYVFGLVYESYESKFGHIPASFTIEIVSDIQFTDNNAILESVINGDIIATHSVATDTRNKANTHNIAISHKQSIYDFTDSLVWALGRIVGHETIYLQKWFQYITDDSYEQLTLRVLAEYLSYSVSCSILSGIDKQRLMEWENRWDGYRETTEIDKLIVDFARYIAICDHNGTLIERDNRLKRIQKQLHGTWTDMSKLTYKAFKKLEKYIKNVIDRGNAK